MQDNTKEKEQPAPKDEQEPSDVNPKPPNLPATKAGLHDVPASGEPSTSKIDFTEAPNGRT